MPDSAETSEPQKSVVQTERSVDLTTPKGIKYVYDTIYEQKMRTDKGWRDWKAEHVAILEDVRKASSEEWATPQGPKRLWEDNPVSSAGASSVSMEKAIEDRELARWIGQQAKSVLPPKGPARIDALEAIHKGMCERVRLLTERMPWLRILRVMAALYPEDFSNVANKHMLRKVAAAMFGKLSKDERNSPVRMNARILDRLAEVLRPTDGSLDQLAQRAEFVWCLYETLSGGSEEETGVLVFMPGERRLKGISVIPDPVNTILDVVEFVSQNSPTRSATVDFILERYPTVKRISATQYLSCVWNTFGMLRLNGEMLDLTPDGQRFLETQDLDILVKPFVTKSIGPDLVLWQLDHRGATSKGELVAALKEHYRGWTTNFMPGVTLTYGRVFGLWLSDGKGTYNLTDRGRKWAKRITDKPQPVAIVGVLDEDEPPAHPPEFTAPTVNEILAAFRRGKLVFPDEVVIYLHGALHANEGKHFVLLSGLSGAGKTQLALTYADAYHRVTPGQPNPYRFLAAVQPDWTDPSGMLGYINPLSAEPSYVRTQCLQFLLRVHENPNIPFFLCLDEMNLARVEYYFAPFLSAMETGGDLVIHQEKGNVDDVPPSIPWPKNLFIFGTVNMDETTHAFSDKVLDRAFTVEFWNVDLDEYARRFAAANPGYPRETLDITIDVLKQAAAILQDVHQHFGYRTAGEVLGFIKACGKLLPREKVLDQAIFMKVLPKIRGQDTESMRGTLDKLGTWADKSGFLATAAKVRAMADELRNVGTTRFWR